MAPPYSYSGARYADIPKRIQEMQGRCFIYLEKTKTKNKREIPINDDLAEVFREIRRDEGLTSKHVFTYNSETIQRVERAFKGALRRAGIDDFRFHDLRHTFASHLIMRGQR